MACSDIYGMHANGMFCYLHDFMFWIVHFVLLNSLAYTSIA